MVWESSFWKDRLLEATDRLRATSAKEEPTDEEVAGAELDLFTGFFIVRKLIEAQTKLSRAVMDMQIRVYRCPKIPSAPLTDFMNRYDLIELYDLEKDREEFVTVGFLSNIFIHSYIMAMSVSEDFTVDGFFVTSDWRKEEAIWFVSLEMICHVFETVGNDYPTLLSMKRNADSGALEMVWKD